MTNLPHWPTYRKNAKATARPPDVRPDGPPTSGGSNGATSSTQVLSILRSRRKARTIGGVPTTAHANGGHGGANPRRVGFASRPKRPTPPIVRQSGSISIEVPQSPLEERERPQLGKSEPARRATRERGVNPFPQISCLPLTEEEDAPDEDAPDEDAPDEDTFGTLSWQPVPKKKTPERSFRLDKRRGAFTKSVIEEEEDFEGALTRGMTDLEVTTKVKDWLKSFRDLDPRNQILEFFNLLALEGVESFESRGCRTKGALHTPAILRIFIKFGIFSVWRPTSPDAIRKMITGEGTGKGLDIKGKSAKCGEWSGYVPFLQIHDNEHKQKVGCMMGNHRVRVFYPNQSSRDEAMRILDAQSEAMDDKAMTAMETIQGEEEVTGPFLDNIIEEEDEERDHIRDSWSSLQSVDEALAEANRYLMDDPSVYEIDDYASTEGIFGLDIPEKLFWECYVVPNDITREKGSKFETGRPSMPEFQQMNIDTLRNWSEKSSDHDADGDNAKEGGESFEAEADPRPVLWHGGCGRVGDDCPAGSNPLCPVALLMAYEENGKVTPVVSDFDCFLLGTRGVTYKKPFGKLELSMLSSCVEEVGNILETQKGGESWTARWLEVKKKHAKDEKMSHQMPKFGYADPLSYSMMTGAVHHLKSNGAVRHGPECFNYGFPQELDDEFLVISDTFPGVPWRYTNCEELIDILCDKIDEGFTFPLNPKWILCDPGWKKVYGKLLAAKEPHVQSSLDIWYPDEIRRRINEISDKFPQGFVSAEGESMSKADRFILAQLELQKMTEGISKRGSLCDTVIRLLGHHSGPDRSTMVENSNKKFRARATVY